MQIEITDQQLQNLVAFLGRVQLGGNEVPAFNELLSVLTPKQEVKKEEKKK